MKTFYTSRSQDGSIQARGGRPVTLRSKLLVHDVEEAVDIEGLFKPRVWHRFEEGHAAARDRATAQKHDALRIGRAAGHKAFIKLDPAHRRHRDV